MTANVSARGPRGVIARLAAAVLCLALVGATKPPAKAPGKTGSTPAAAAAMDTKADIALLVDYATGTTLFEKNAERSFPPASLTKMMTMAVTFREIAEGRLSLDGEFPISEHAWRTGGAPSHTSSMFAPINSKAKIVDLLQGVMIQSANDGAIAIAEGIAGTESAFADLMNRRAKEIGLENSNFTNPTGLPDPANRSTARDLAAIARHLITDYPDLYKFYSQREFTYNKIRQLNRNPLLAEGLGADGVKTGYIKESGYNIVGSAVQNGQRLIVVIGGAATEKERGEDARKLLDWGFRTFESVRLYGAGESIGEAMVFGGTANGVKVAAAKNVDILIPRGNRDKLRARVVYTGPIKAPIAKDQPIGKLVVTRNEQVIQEIPVAAAESIEVGTLRQRAVDGTRELLMGLLRR
ncbi:D-alanyl-D-alanine carboxypeptidase [Siculibacillus lacustris]|uniref:serine-type D-Ala-D-Ala carboxypeptidase n=1 Tax=Siculibacillus lacustris TaxID=1549641 RepID=A0A4Q9VMZ3_9HYPH|nr:D-alanyl-D-alanine carboxypeptidase family protein [Siculibacillus lacustris]TBW37002.1 D-alanyl-D-alanine carboxypeptidase [Siculibacillus lacustris]